MAANAKKTRKPMSYEKKKQLYGLGFISLWLIGLAQYFIRPLINLVRFSLSDIVITDTGFVLEHVGLRWYNQVLLIEPGFLQSLALSFGELVYRIPIIVVFSLLIAIILNQKFKGRLFARAVFFVPVIVASGIVIEIISGDIMSEMLRGGDRVPAGSMLQMLNFSNLLLQLGLPVRMILPVINAASDVFALAWRSGVQILILIAGLQTISPALYEASSIEGATGWENLWKITIPMISPMIVLVVIYTVIDAFVSYDNWLMRDITSAATRLDTSRAAAMAFTYFLVVLVFVVILYAIINKFALYLNDDVK